MRRELESLGTVKASIIVTKDVNLQSVVSGCVLLSSLRLYGVRASLCHSSALGKVGEEWERIRE